MNTDPTECRVQSAKCRMVNSALCILRSALCIPLVLSLWTPAPASAQQPTPKDTIPLPLTAGEADGERPRRNLFPYLNWDWGFTTFHLGLATGFDIAWFSQDDDSKDQVTMDQGLKWRDFRFVGSGRFNTKRPATWQIGVMWDGVSEDWFIRQTGIMVAVPEISGSIFLGRAKEGISLSKVIQGYQ